MIWADYFYCDPSSPSGLRWKVDRLTGRGYARKVVSEGDVAGWLCDYWHVTCCGSSYLVSRIIYEMSYAAIPEGFDIDHINGNPLDNTPCNLRAVPEELNMRNKCKMRNNSSGVTGVSWDNKRNGSGVRKLYAKAEWMASSGKKVSKTFSAEKFGILPAFNLACMCRLAAIVELNNGGAGYTNRHGCD